MAVNHALVTLLKRRRAAFVASGQLAKVPEVDAEIARLRGDLPPVDMAAAEPSGMETGDADLAEVETAARVRRRRNG